MKGLTPRQRQILDWTRSYIAKHAIPPTIREIGAAFSIPSTNAVIDHLVALERKGFIVRGEMKSRSLRVVGMNVATQKRVAADVELVDAVKALDAADLPEEYTPTEFDAWADARELVLEKARAWAREQKGGANG